MSTNLHALREQVAVQRLGQSVYAEPGRLSSAQRQHDSRAMLDLIEKIAERTGYAAGYEVGHRAGRLDMARYIGPTHLADAIRRDLDRLRADLDAAGVCCASERVES